MRPLSFDVRTLQFSRGEDLSLVLYPGAGAGRRRLGLERLRPGARYQIRGAAVPEIQADGSGAARFEVDLTGRTALHVVPA